MYESYSVDKGDCVDGDADDADAELRALAAAELDAFAPLGGMMAKAVCE